MLGHRALSLLRPFAWAPPPLAVTPEKRAAFEAGGPGPFPARSLRNGCGAGRFGSRYWFPVEPRPGAGDPWRDGWVSVLPREGSTPHPVGSEWTCPDPVRPLGKVPVGPADFPFLDRVLRHRGGEPNAVTVWRAVARA